MGRKAGVSSEWPGIDAPKAGLSSGQPASSAFAPPPAGSTDGQVAGPYAHVMATGPFLARGDGTTRLIANIVIPSEKNSLPKATKCADSVQRRLRRPSIMIAATNATSCDP